MARKAALSKRTIFSTGATAAEATLKVIINYNELDLQLLKRFVYSLFTNLVGFDPSIAPPAVTQRGPATLTVALGHELADAEKNKKLSVFCDCEAANFQIEGRE